MMTALGGIFVDLQRVLPEDGRLYLAELRDRFGPAIHFDVRGREADWGDIPGPVRWLSPDTRSLAIASARAAESGHLLVLFAPVLPNPALVRELIEAFEFDELVGFIQPRFSEATTDAIWFLPGDDRPSAGHLPRQTMSLLPEYYLTTENLAACVAIRREVAATIVANPQQGQDGRSTLLHEMRNARRRGYRTLVMNRLVVASSEPHDSVYLLPERAGRVGTSASARKPQTRSADEWFDGATHRRRELLVAKARRARPEATLPVLLDCRGVVAHHNGTSEAIFGLLSGLGVEKPNWQIELLFNADAAGYHKVISRFPAMSVSTTLPNRSFAAAVRLNQPWHVSTVRELHDLALTISFHILDTIAWDVVYLANSEVDRVWHFIAEHADGLAYISGFTKDRFNFRFPVASPVLQTVSYLSLAPDDHRDADLRDVSEGRDILVFGNHYDHKAVTPTVELLSRAFPFRTIHAVGAKVSPHFNVVVEQSGHMPAAEIEHLIATAAVVVFPSHYEGFGLPVIKALAYGRNVVVRSSTLWHEVAGLMRMPGRLIDFVTPQDLVRAVGQVLAGEQTSTLPFGGSLKDGEPPPDWAHCARRLVGLVEGSLADVTPQRWYARDRALALK